MTILYTLLVTPSNTYARRCTRLQRESYILWLHRCDPSYSIAPVLTNKSTMQLPSLLPQRSKVQSMVSPHWQLLIRVTHIGWTMKLMTFAFFDSLALRVYRIFCCNAAILDWLLLGTLFLRMPNKLNLSAPSSRMSTTCLSTYNMAYPRRWLLRPTHHGGPTLQILALEAKPGKYRLHSE